VNWDRNDDWVLERFYEERARVFAVLPPEGDRVQRVGALRRCVSALRHVSPAALLSRARRDGQIDLGEMAGREARRLAEHLADAGVDTRVIDASVTTYLPINRTTSEAWHIDDPEEARRIAEEMIANGVPVVDVEA
jgi:hypothetical protein